MQAFLQVAPYVHGETAVHALKTHAFSGEFDKSALKTRSFGCM
jgi:hypothetical protein